MYCMMQTRTFKDSYKGHALIKQAHAEQRKRKQKKGEMRKKRRSEESRKRAAVIFNACDGVFC